MKPVFYIVLLFFTVSCQIARDVKRDKKKFEAQLPYYTVVKKSDSLSTIGTDFLIQNKTGNWELKISGTPFELGTKNGLLTQNLYTQQQAIFFAEVKKMVPSAVKRVFLLQFLKWYNRDMVHFIKEEYRQEIYALSQQSQFRYPLLGSNYQRDLMIQGAHDIGHAMQDLMLVGCSSFGVWNDKTADGTLLIGRNFDFYVNDAFAENKLIQFITPEKGIPFAAVSWPGMIGVASGMNAEGLTVTINAGRSAIPLKAKTPVSLVVREILQYAKTIEEAIAIARNKEIFVSEALLIGSAHDNTAVILEMSPNKFQVYHSDKENQIICTNHFQSNDYREEEQNTDQFKNGHSAYRFETLQQHLNEKKILSVNDVAAILRDTDGHMHENIGKGNEKALNQLMAHHAVIFQPKEKIMWVSSAPYNLGTFTGYRLDAVFAKNATEPLNDPLLTIPSDHFMETDAFRNFEQFRELTRKIKQKTNAFSVQELEQYVALNPEFWKAYFIAGKYCYEKGYYALAKSYFQKALTKEISSAEEKEMIKKYLKNY